MQLMSVVRWSDTTANISATWARNKAVPRDRSRPHNWLRRRTPVSGSTLGFAVGSGRKDPFSPPVKNVFRVKECWTRHKDLTVRDICKGQRTDNRNIRTHSESACWIRNIRRWESSIFDRSVFNEDVSQHRQFVDFGKSLPSVSGQHRSFL